MSIELRPEAVVGRLRTAVARTCSTVRPAHDLEWTAGTEWVRLDEADL